MFKTKKKPMKSYNFRTNSSDYCESISYTFLKIAILSQAQHLWNKILSVSVKILETLRLFRARIKETILKTA